MMKDGWVAVHAANILTSRLSSSSTGGSEGNGGGGASLEALGSVFGTAESAAGWYGSTPMAPQSVQSVPSSQRMTVAAFGLTLEPSSHVPSLADSHVSQETPASIVPTARTRRRQCCRPASANGTSSQQQ